MTTKLRTALLLFNFVLLLLLIAPVCGSDEATPRGKSGDRRDHRHHTSSKEYEGMNVLCVGCSSGIGRSAAEILLEGGAQVVVASYNYTQCVHVVERYRPAATAVEADVTSKGDLENLVAKARMAFKGASNMISHLVYTPTALKVVPWQGDVEAILDSMQDQMQINVYSLVRLYKLIRDDLFATGGAVVTVSSVSAEMATFDRPAYGIAKAAQERLVKDIALDLSVAGGRANTIRPGATDTPIFEIFASEELRNKFKAEYAWRHALKRLAQPDEMGHMIAFLLSKKSGFVTGQNFAIDGGIGLMNSMVDLYSPLIPPDQQVPGHFVFKEGGEVPQQQQRLELNLGLKDEPDL